jgi:hypothetical protein
VTKRDLISEIQAKKLRFPDYHQASFRLFYLQHGFNEHEKSAPQPSPIHSLFLIGIVACLEVAIRDAIRKLIDHGSPFINRISQFKDVLRLDVNVGRALHDRKVSFGDWVSHLLPVSNLEQINSHFSILFAADFGQVLTDAREFVEPSISDLLGNDTKAEDEEPEAESEISEAPDTLLPISDIGELMASLGRLFKARHIAAHEADFELISGDDVRGFFRTAEVFIHAIDEIVSQIIEPNMPRTALGMSLVAARDAGKARREMQELETKLLRLFAEQEIILTGTDDASEIIAFKAAQEAFEKHVDAEVAFELARVGMISGNGMRMLEAQTLKDFCEFRIKRLRQAIDWIEESWDIEDGDRNSK